MGTVHFKSWRAPFFPFKIVTYLMNTDYQVPNVWPLLRCTNCRLEIKHRSWHLHGWLSIPDNNLLFGASPHWQETACVGGLAIPMLSGRRSHLPFLWCWTRRQLPSPGLAWLAFWRCFPHTRDSGWQVIGQRLPPWSFSGLPRWLCQGSPWFLRGWGVTVRMGEDACLPLCSGRQPGGGPSGGCSPCPFGWAPALGTRCPGAASWRSAECLQTASFSQLGPAEAPGLLPCPACRRHWSCPLPSRRR